jgi:hypothetical protein
MPIQSFKWFLAAFAIFWLAISGAQSLIGGWYELSRRFKSSKKGTGHLLDANCLISLGWLFTSSAAGYAVETG